MDRLKQKLKKEKQGKDCSKDKNPVFITDVKSIKENLKIKEILRTVKMNSSMRLKAPPGSKVMSNRDFNEDDYFEESSISVNSSDLLSATNPDVIVNKLDEEEGFEVRNDDLRETNPESININDDVKLEENNSQENSTDNRSVELSNNGTSQNIYRMVDIEDKSAYEYNERTNEKGRERKLSLDHAMLSRQDGFTQSELDLHTIGKSPLERKYSFFRKKMDSFVRNTTEMFRKQNSSLQRRMSMSVSLQSLNDKCCTSEINETPPSYHQEPLGSRTSLHTASPIARSTSSLSLAQSGILPSSSSQTSLAGSQPALSSPTFEDDHSSSVHSFNEDFITEAMLNSRAISMSSGLDTPYGQQRRKASRANRVTWIASEGLTNYLRRKIQDEKSKEMQTCHSYQDFSCIPENDLYSRKPDSKGRRLSYQRAVSGEDPMPIRYQDSTLRRRQQIPEYIEVNVELACCLEDYTKNSIPLLAGFDVEPVPEEALAYLLWATKPKNIEDVFDTKTLSPKEQALQAVIRELINTEADYIKHLTVIVEVFIAAALDIQSKGKMLSIETEKLFSNLPDLLNANICFWNLTFVPMIKEAITKCEPFNTNMMSQGFASFKDVFMPYEKFVVNHSQLIQYYRMKQQVDSEFAMYITWCHKQKQCNRLQLNDFLVKPMQRMTKYSLILDRIIHYTDSESHQAALEIMEKITKSFACDVNRSVRQREELDKLELLDSTIEEFEVIQDTKDLEAISICKSFAKLNLTAPMLHCLSHHSRSVVYQGEMRFRDGAKDNLARVTLLTDMIVICKKLARGLEIRYKQIRTRYMIDKTVQIPRFVSKNNKDIASLLYVVVDDLGSASASFVLSEMPKDPNPQLTLRTWENKFNEAKLTYELSTLIAQNPNKELTQDIVDNAAEYTNTKSRFASEAGLIENAARERVATMSHRSMGATTDRDFSQMTCHSFEGTGYTPQNHIVTGASARLSGRYQKCTIAQRTTLVPNNITPPRDSQYSSVQQLPSARPLEEPQAGPSKPITPDVSLDQLHSTLLQPDINGASITFKVSESDADITPIQQLNTELESSSSKSVTSLRVQPNDNGAVLMYNLPDLTIEPCTPRSTSSLTQPTASEKMYQIHQERLKRNKLMTQTQQYLTPDTRGSSYPPPSPTRASLTRSLAFSYSVKNPPLSKMGHVNSQSQGHLDSVQHRQEERSASPKSSSSLGKGDKKSKLSSSRKKKRDVSEDRQSEPCDSKKHGSLSASQKESQQPSRKAKSSCSDYKDESPGTSYKGGSIDICFRAQSTSFSHRDDSPGTSYKSESPEPSYREISPNASSHYESPVPSNVEGSFDRSSVEVSSTPGPTKRSNDSLPRSDSRGVDVENTKTDAKDQYRTSRQSKSSDSYQKEKSLSLSLKDESYDSSHRDGSLCLSHKDEASSLDHKESHDFKDKKSERYFRQQSSSIESHCSSDDDSSDNGRAQDIYDIFNDIEISSVICKPDPEDTIDGKKISDAYERLKSSSSSPSDEPGQSLRLKSPETTSKAEEPIITDEIAEPSCSHDIRGSSPSLKEIHQGSVVNFEFDDSTNTSSGDEKCS